MPRSDISDHRRYFLENHRVFLQVARSDLLEITTKAYLLLVAVELWLKHKQPDTSFETKIVYTSHDIEHLNNLLDLNLRNHLISPISNVKTALGRLSAMTTIGNIDSIQLKSFPQLRYLLRKPYDIIFTRAVDDAAKKIVDNANTILEVGRRRR